MKKVKLVSMIMFFVAGGIMLITSCKKEEDAASIIGTWKMTAAVFNPAVDLGNGPTTDAYSLMFGQPCKTDDLIIFQENGVEIDDAGALLCNPNDPQQQTSNYTYSGSTLTMMGANDTTVVTNVVLTSNTLTGSISADLGIGPLANVDFTLTRQ